MAIRRAEWTRLLQRLIPRDPRLRMVKTELIASDYLIATLPVAATDGDGRASLCRWQKQAVDAVDCGDVDEAWAYIYAIREHCLLYYPLKELQVRARVLCTEVADEGRLAPWRREAIEEALQDSEGWRDEKVARTQLCEAIRLRNAGITNQYLRLEVTRHYQALLLLVGMPLLITTIVLLALNGNAITEPQWGLTWPAVALSAVLGALGAAASAGQRSTRIKAEHVIVQLGSNVASLSRIPIGVVAGLTVWLFSVATTNGAHIVAPNMLVAAFGAGFAERFAVLHTAPPETSFPRRRPHVGQSTADEDA